MIPLLKNSKLIVIFLSILFSTAITAQTSLPDFTSIVDKNIKAVVIVNAVRNISEQSPNDSFNSPKTPDDLRDFMEKFFNDRNFGNQNRPTPSFGSGFIISKDGFIMTNYHVIKDSDTITATLSDRTILDAKLIGFDERSDLALLKVTETNLPTVSMGKSKNLKVGEWVLAIGSPFGFDHTVTAGIVSGKQRNLPNENYVPYIQTDVAINPGNSGGPLFNLNGEVVGVNAQIYSRTGGFMGVSFAIPSETVSSVYNQLKQTGKVRRGWLGIFIQEVDKNLAKSFGMNKPTGAVVAKVLEDSPAEKAGLSSGDVILQFDGNNINKSKDLPLVVGNTEIGKSVSIELLRNGKKIVKKIKIEELPTDEKISKMDSNLVDKVKVAGITVIDIDNKVKQELNINGGVIVKEISNAIANQSRLRIGDIITHMNNVPISNSTDFETRFKKIEKNDYANFLVYRNSSPLYLAIKIP
ncbi:MAG: serine peptidase [Gammaproteobacteria bacterium]|nr:serine peptidase [Gammaproteobacteria bacterium]